LDSNEYKVNNNEISVHEIINSDKTINYVNIDFACKQCFYENSIKMKKVIIFYNYFKNSGYKII